MKITQFYKRVENTVENLWSYKHRFAELTHYQTIKNLDWSKLKEIADDIFKCIESEK